jgi:hypothetical protein
MNRLALLLLPCCTAMSSQPGLEPVDHIYTVTARQLGEGSCDTPGDPVEFAVPYRELATAGDHPGQQGWTWCDSPTQCDSFDWFEPAGDHWQQVLAMDINTPDNGTACELRFDTLEVTDLGNGNLHVDLLERTADTNDLNDCTIARATATLGTSNDCINIDRYDLAP